MFSQHALPAAGSNFREVRGIRVHLDSDLIQHKIGDLDSIAIGPGELFCLREAAALPPASLRVHAATSTIYTGKRSGTVLNDRNRQGYAEGRDGDGDSGQDACKFKQEIAD